MIILSMLPSSSNTLLGSYWPLTTPYATLISTNPICNRTGMNNIIERMHGSFREREKVMRGIKTVETPIFEGNRIYYNFIRPHEGLDGKTPAEVAGIGVAGEYKWVGLLRSSIDHSPKKEKL